MGAKEANERRPEAQKGVAQAARFLGRMGPPSGASWLRCRRSFRPRLRLDLKPTIEIAPGVDREEAAVNRETTKQRPGPADRRGKTESAWLPPCIVLVINDNLYGLIFVLS